MKEPPNKIKEAFEELKQAYGQRLELRFLNKRFCVFEATSKWDQKRKKPVKITHYIGWMTENGVLVPAKPRYQSGSLKELEFEYEKALEHEQLLKKKREEEKASKESLSGEDILLLKALSMNPRMQHSKIASITGINVHTLEYRIQRLERLLGIKYTLELNMNNLGFSEYLILVKFISSKPSNEDLRRAIEPNAMVQLALATKGAYDLVIFCVAENNNVVAKVLDQIRTAEGLRGIDSEWYITPIATSYGFVPLRQEFFDVLKDKVWHRKKHVEKPNADSLMQREYALLCELNEDSIRSFSSIERKYSLPVGSAKRAYEDLTNEEGKNVIIRPTLTATSIRRRYNAIITANVTNDEKFLESRDNHHKYIINEPDRLISRFSYICDMETPDGIFYMFPVLKEEDLDKIENELSNTIKGVKLDSLIIKNTIIGSICYRKFDNLYSEQYYSLLKRKAITPQKREDYR